MEQRGDGCSFQRTLFLLMTGILFLVLVSLLVSAATTFELSPLTFYEGTNRTFNFTVTTSHLTKSIDELNLTSASLSGISPTNDSQFNQGWDVAAGSSSITWKNNSIPKGSFVIYTYLQFTALLPMVSADRVEQWQFVTTDNTGTQTTRLINVTIQNDPSPPVLSNTYPSGRAFFRAAPQVIAAQAVDLESGVAQVGFNYSTCNTSSTTTLALAKAAEPDNYSTSADFSGLSEGATVCYAFTTRANGGETAAVNGNITIDSTPPVVTLASPADNTFVTGVLNLSFTASDLISPSVSCDVTVGGEVKQSMTLNQSQSTSAEVNTTDGSYAWNVGCADLAGNRGQSSTRTINVDNAPPTIAFTAAPSLVIRGSSVTAVATITDFSGINTVRAHVAINGTNQSMSSSSSGSDYTFSLPILSSTTLGTYSLAVTAEDGVGHVASTNHLYNVTYNYLIALTVPASAVSGHDVTINGTVRVDNASLVKESSITLELPSGAVTVPLDNQSAFSYTFTAPETGTYTLGASVASLDNSITYNQSAVLAITLPSSGPGDSLGFSPRNSRSSSSSGSSSGSPSGASSAASSGSSDSSGASSGVSASAASSSSGTSTGASAASGTGAGAAATGATGVGRAGGFLTQAFLKYSQLLWTLFVVVLVIGVLVYISRGPQAPKVHISTSHHAPPESSSVFHPSFQQPINEQITRHNLDLDEYLRSRLGK